VEEQRQKIKEKLKTATGPAEKAHLQAVQKAMKILANSTTYGIFVELNPEEATDEQAVYSNTSFSTFDNKLERLGEYFHPIVAVMLVSGARLLLALAEEYVTSKGYKYAYMDTDSISVQPDIADELSKYFQKLNYRGLKPAGSCW
jgi:DNA polymerase elongation subunit (family B)